MRDSKDIAVFVLTPVIALILVVLVACGGGSGSAENTDISGRITAEGGVIVATNTSQSSLVALFTDFALVSTAYAQDSDQEIPLVGALIELRAVDGTLIASTNTNENGEFEFRDIAAGDYTITVSDPSIEPLTIEGVTVLEGDITVIHGTVTVNGNDVSVDYRVGDCGLVVENRGQLGHATALAEAAGIAVDEVIAIRETSCQGWGLIAQQLELPPATLGLGHTNAQGGGRPEHAGGGRPEDQGNGRPDHAGGGRPDHAGPPEWANGNN